MTGPPPSVVLAVMDGLKVLGDEVASEAWYAWKTKLELPMICILC